MFQIGSARFKSSRTESVLQTCSEKKQALRQLSVWLAAIARNAQRAAEINARRRLR
jgi:hypothetical protein